MAVATHAQLVADGLRERLPKRDADVFNRVMGVDLQIAGGGDIDIDQAVTRDLVEHVVEKRHARGKRGHPAAIQVELDADLRFLGAANDVGGSHACEYPAVIGEEVAAIRGWRALESVQCRPPATRWRSIAATHFRISGIVQGLSA